jgi:hypothetical protein
LEKAPGETLMHSAIIVVTMPNNEQRWNKFIADVDRLGTAQPDPLRKRKDVEQLATNVWLVNFQQNPEPLARIVSAATQHRLPHRILQLDAAPQWLRVDSNPEPKGVPKGYTLEAPDD